MCSSLGWNRSSAHSNRIGSILLRRVESNSRTTMLSSSSPRTSYRQRHVVPLSSPYTYFLVNRRRRCPKIEASRRRVAKSARWYCAKVFKVRDLSDFHAPIRRSRGAFISGAFPSNACVSDRRQRETNSRTEPSVEAASCSLDAMVRRFHGDHVESVQSSVKGLNCLSQKRRANSETEAGWASPRIIDIPLQK
jgi:hypothetical protein